MQQVRLALLRRRSFSFMDLVHFAGSFAVTFALFAIEFTASTAIQLGTLGLRFTQWVGVGVFSVAAVATTYLREYVALQSRQREVLRQRLVLDLIAALVPG